MIDAQTTAAANITDSQIRALRDESCNAHDLPVYHACCLVLGEQGQIDDMDQWEDRYGGGGHDVAERRMVIGMDYDAAMALIRKCLRDGQG